MTADEFAALVKTLRELGAWKVRSGDFECTFATPYVPPETKVQAAPTPPPVPPSRPQKPQKLRSDVETEEQRRLAQLREELEN